ncbi:hypothetical protein OF83DRAFT_1055229 [Amylostereum chailletii]|nr:hypothetical protein OF83DRAFT_1055229 [Amylostereum chailletii]
MFSFPAPTHLPRYPGDFLSTPNLLTAAESLPPLPSSLWNVHKTYHPIHLPQHPPPPYTPTPPTYAPCLRRLETELGAGPATPNLAPCAASSILDTSPDARSDGAVPTNGSVWDFDPYAREPSLAQSSAHSDPPSALALVPPDAWSPYEPDNDDLDSADPIPDGDHDADLPVPDSGLDRERPPASGPSRRTRKSPKMHQCTVCSKQFPRPSGLQTHMHTHSGEKPFKCPVSDCSKRFAVRSNAKRHLRTHGTRPEPAPAFPFASSASKDGGGMRFVPQARGRQKIPASLRLLPPPRPFEPIIPLRDLETVPDMDMWDWAGDKAEGRSRSGPGARGHTGAENDTCLKTLPPARAGAGEERDSYAWAGEEPYYHTQVRDFVSLTSMSC